ncbi:MAG TPA: hypothetical protein VI197_32010, partial [Polyangiaceae bacterium]
MSSHTPPRRSSNQLRAFTLSALCALFSGACGGSAPPPEEPPPAFDDEEGPSGGGSVAKASSSAVQEGIDAIQAEDFAKAKE